LIKKKIIIKEENFKWYLEAFASELFIFCISKHYMQLAQEYFKAIEVIIKIHIKIVGQQALLSYKVYNVYFKVHYILYVLYLISRGEC